VEAGLDEAALAQAIDALPSGLAVFYDGPAALPRLLAMCTLERLRRESDLLRLGIGPTVQAADSAIEDPHFGDHRDRWRHAVSTVIEWHGLFGRPAPTRVPPPADNSAVMGRAGRRSRRRSHRAVTHNDYEAAVALAAAFYELDPIRVGCRTGDVYIEKAVGRHVWISNRRRPDVEVLDILLTAVTVVARSEPDHAHDAITDWFSREGGRTNVGLMALPRNSRKVCHS